MSIDEITVIKDEETPAEDFELIVTEKSVGSLETNIRRLELLVEKRLEDYRPENYMGDADLAKKDRAELNKAKDIYDKILLKNNATAETLHQYAVLSSSLCDTDTAEKILKKVIKMNPDMAKAHKDLGVIYLNKRF